MCAFKSRKVMFITRAELARWWTKGVANFRFRKKSYILIISLKSQKYYHGSTPSTTAPPLACLTPSVTRLAWCSQTWGNLFHLWVNIIPSIYEFTHADTRLNLNTTYRISQLHNCSIEQYIYPIQQHNWTGSAADNEGGVRMWQAY